MHSNCGMLYHLFKLHRCRTKASKPFNCSNFLVKKNPEESDVKCCQFYHLNPVSLSPSEAASHTQRGGTRPWQLFKYFPVLVGKYFTLKCTIKNNNEFYYNRWFITSHPLHASLNDHMAIIIIKCYFNCCFRVGLYPNIRSLEYYSGFNFVIRIFFFSNWIYWNLHYQLKSLCLFGGC